ncbi:MULTISPECIES: hypothetical protein [Xanthomonas]|nr:MULTISPECIES: hypothetical protein [Xanthomonas]CEE27967.1 conserved hypothetical protein [Xanthomonas citri pv. citri]CEE28167.1 conserved hypothetical protein [Xanthomonas citri pv. citri]CEE55348.1 conserved hypothetical protein [Xanthomonas citri pv. citri]CEF22811.1 conserved hypothetical protein [Xanthomonas citri pv. citri]CEH59016.1 conserved hypothetical protein [Xanthomonas citri pv. citri]
MNVHQDDSGLASARPMRSGYYWFVDQYGSAAEIVDVDVDEGFVHLIARDSPLYFPGADTAQAAERVTFGTYYGPLSFQNAAADKRLPQFKFETLRSQTMDDDMQPAKQITLESYTRDADEVKFVRHGEEDAPISHILLRIVEGASVALYRHKDTSTAELLPSRRDLFNYEGGYGWGYGGSGPQNLSHAIASRIFLLDNLDDQELRRRARVILDKVISQPSLNSETNHDVTVESIKQLFV